MMSHRQRGSSCCDSRWPSGLGSEVDEVPVFSFPLRFASGLANGVHDYGLSALLGLFVIAALPTGDPTAVR